MARPSSGDSSVDRIGLQGSRWVMKSGRFKISRGSDDEGDIGDGLQDSVSLDSFSQDGSATPKLERDAHSSLNRMNNVFVQLQSEFAQAVVRGSSASSTAPAPDSSSNRDASTQQDPLQAASSHHSSPGSASLTVPPRPTSPATSQSSLGSLSVAGNEALGQWRSLGSWIEKATKLNRTLEQKNRMLKEEKRRKQLELEECLAELETARHAASQGQSGKPTASQDAQELSRLADSVQQQKLEQLVTAFNQVTQSKDKQSQPAQQPEQDKEPQQPLSPPPQPPAQQSQQPPPQQQQQQQQQQQHTPPKGTAQQQPKSKQDIMQEEAQKAFNQIKEQQLLQQQQQQSHPQPDFADEPTRSND